LQQLTHNTIGFDDTLDEMIRKYGEDNGHYLYEEMTRYKSQYSRLTFIETGLESGGPFFADAMTRAREKGWTFDRLPGDLAWLSRLVSGEWPAADFVIAEPGQRIVASYDIGVIRAEGAQS